MLEKYASHIIYIEHIRLLFLDEKQTVVAKIGKKIIGRVFFKRWRDYCQTFYNIKEYGFFETRIKTILKKAGINKNRGKIQNNIYITEINI